MICNTYESVDRSIFSLSFIRERRANTFELTHGVEVYFSLTTDELHDEIEGEVGAEELLGGCK